MRVSDGGEGMSEQQIGIIFHGIGKPGRTLDASEAPYWISEDRFVAVLDRLMARPDRHRFRLSFDDGNVSDHDTALPHLLARGLSADFFVLTGRIGQAGSLSEPQIRALRDAGMGIGSHGVGHVRWSDLAADALARELKDSRRSLEAVTGDKVDTAGIPFGAYNARVLKGLRDAGYKTAYSSDRGLMTQDGFLRPRTSVRSDMDDAELSNILAGRMPTGQRLRRAIGMARRRWL